MRLSFIILPLAVAVVGAWEDTTHCVYFCKTSQGRFFCCDSGDKGAQRPEVHQGQCPPVRPQCPGNNARRPPRSCAHDGQCPSRSKCCYDICLQWTVCKRAESNTGIFGLQEDEYNIQPRPFRSNKARKG